VLSGTGVAELFVYLFGHVFVRVKLERKLLFN
jgi:hypothetical protein